MTTYVGSLIPTTVHNAVLSSITFSGTVKLDGVGVIRDIKGCKVLIPEVIYETASDSSGNWELTMPGGTNVEFRIIAVGADGENSQIYDHLTG